jgi:cellulose synthase/poly-beta-1,6-N-acetylglucosamine synthase-like glycosyltransferase
MAVLVPLWILLTALLALPVIVFAVEVIAALPRRAPVEVAPGDPGPRTVVLVPAHDEEHGIGTTLRAIGRGLGPRDHVLVVADNCTDGTARVARETGAQVVERRDAQRRGKSFALEYGIAQLRGSPPEVVTIVDADCQADPDSLRALARQAVATRRPVQALYLMHAPPELGIPGRIAEFAWRVKNEARPLGMLRLGLPCHLTGSGMAFPWQLISGAKLASGHLAEDMQLGIELAAAGAGPLFLPESRVYSRFAANAAGAASQRTRWEHGHLQVITTEVPRLAWRALRTGNAKLFGLALDLCVPPLALLVLLSVASLALSALLTLVPGVPRQVLVIPAGALLLMALAVLAAWARFGREVLPFRDLLLIPFYVLRKVPLYLRFVTARQKDWVRSQRDGRPPE